MTTSVKAVLLSALVCPGAGQWYLKRYRVALVLLLITAAALVSLLIPTVAVAQALAGQLASGELRTSTDLLSELQSATQEVTASAGPATVTLLAVWIAGIVHAGWAVRQQDLQ